MGRPPSRDPRVHQLRVRLTRAEAERLDKVRGGLSRSEFVRHLIRRAR